VETKKRAGWERAGNKNRVKVEIRLVEPAEFDFPIDHSHANVVWRSGERSGSQCGFSQSAPSIRKWKVRVLQITPDAATEGALQSKINRGREALPFRLVEGFEQGLEDDLQRNNCEYDGQHGNRRGDCQGPEGSRVRG
jgi:hypothetical protein